MIRHLLAAIIAIASIYMIVAISAAVYAYLFIL